MLDAILEAWQAAARCMRIAPSLITMQTSHMRTLPVCAHN